MSKPEPVTFDIDGADLAVRVAGDRKKPALLLIHGFPSSSESFRNVIASTIAAISRGSRDRQICRPLAARGADAVGAPRYLL